MPVIGEPTPFPLTLLYPRPNETVRKAVAKLSEHFPKPYSFISSMGFNLRKQRLGVELAEFDFLHRTRRNKPASLDLLYLVGETIILPRKNRFPTEMRPLDRQLFVSPASFEILMWIAAEKMPSRKQVRRLKRRAKPLRDRGSSE